MSIEKLGETKNIEIKASISSDDEFQTKLNIGNKLDSGAPIGGKILKQRDVFFKVPIGRLKMRYFGTESNAELIYYNRGDSKGPKTSSYKKVEMSYTTALDMEDLLSKIHSIRGEVKKTRHLFLYKRSRIHLDEVEGLGKYLEFEVCMNDQMTQSEADAEMKELLNVFDVLEENLIEKAYIDCIEGKN